MRDRQSPSERVIESLRVVRREAAQAGVNYRLPFESNPSPRGEFQTELRKLHVEAMEKYHQDYLEMLDEKKLKSLAKFLVDKDAAYEMIYNTAGVVVDIVYDSFCIC